MLAMLLFVEGYLYSSKLHEVFENERTKKIAKVSYIVLLIIQYGGSLFLYYYLRNEGPRIYPFNVLQALVWSIFIIKFFIILPLLLIGTFYGIIEYFIKLFNGQEALAERVAPRREFIKKLSLITASVPFASFLFGMTLGKYNYKVHKIALAFKDLPDAFDGFKIAQFSDFHAGSFDSLGGVRKGLNMLQEQNADVILFTGDLVNQLADEVEPYFDEFKVLDAPYGVYACTGNHDYGYRGEESRTEANRKAIKDNYGKCGLQLLNNAHVKLERQGQHINIAGVENWGAARFFPKRGDLDKAFEGLDSDEFTVLMSHDPTHWDAQIKEHSKKVHLTLSGHTHGAQMGVELFGKKWSPGKYFYKRWAGLFSENDQHLYVNRGFGMLEGFMFRVGIFPEITLIELKKA